MSTFKTEVGFKVPKKYHAYEGWTLDFDCHTGALYYHKGEIAVYCTPNWEGYEGVCIGVMFPDGNDINVDVPQKDITPAKWFAIVKPYLDKHGNVIPKPAKKRDVKDDVLDQSKHLTSEKWEHVLAYLLDGQSNILSVEKVSIGTTTATLAHPREIFRPALLWKAVAVILVHNHPSGDPTPSDEDIRLTKRVAQAGMILGIELRDHMIMAKNGTYSFRQAGLLGA